eukprot:g4458.t1
MQKGKELQLQMCCASIRQFWTRQRFCWRVLCFRFLIVALSEASQHDFHQTKSKGFVGKCFVSSSLHFPRLHNTTTSTKTNEEQGFVVFLHRCTFRGFTTRLHQNEGAKSGLLTTFSFIDCVCANRLAGAIACNLATPWTLDIRQVAYNSRFLRTPLFTSKLRSDYLRLNVVVLETVENVRSNVVTFPKIVAVLEIFKVLQNVCCLDDGVFKDEYLSTCLGESFRRLLEEMRWE